MNELVNNMIRRFGRITSACPAMFTIALLCPSASADTVRLHDKAGSAEPRVRLGDIAEVTGLDAERWSRVVVATFHDDADSVSVTLDDVRAALETEGAHWGKLSLGGFARCEVVRIDKEQQVDAQSGAPIASNTESAIDLDSPMTLRELAIAKIVERTGADLGDLNIKFTSRDEHQLGRSTIHDRFELTIPRESALGEVPILVHRIRAGQVVETFHVTADVERRMIALVATKPIAQREAFLPDSVEVRQIYLRESSGEPLVNPAVVIGQKARRPIREGAAILPDDIQSPLFVRRGELVTVECVVNGVMLTTVAKADADGSLGDEITVRNDRTRQHFSATVTGPQKVSVQPGQETEAEARVADAQGSQD